MSLLKLSKSLDMKLIGTLVLFELKLALVEGNSHLSTLYFWTQVNNSKDLFPAIRAADIFFFKIKFSKITFLSCTFFSQVGWRFTSTSDQVPCYFVSIHAFVYKIEAIAGRLLWSSVFSYPYCVVL